MKNILIVDDEISMREMLVDFLSIVPNLAFHGTGNGLEACKLLRENRYDLVICDFQLPGRDGLQLLEFINEENLAVPVVWISGNATPKQFRESWSRGVFDFFEKPMDMDVFLASIKKALSL